MTRTVQQAPVARRRVLPFAAIAGLTLLLAACAEKGPPKTTVTLTPVTFADLRGWTDDRQDRALAAFRRSCPKLLDGTTAAPAAVPLARADWTEACAAAAAVLPDDGAGARTFFETWFEPRLVSDGTQADGLFTGYFEAELHGALTRDDTNHVPLYGRPPDLYTVDLGRFDETLAGRTIVGRAVDGKLVPYHRRGEIEAGALDGATPVLAWVDDPLDAFLLQVQGSGRILLRDGGVLRLGFAGHNGHPYESIGKVLVRRGDLPAGQAGWTQIRAWLESHPDKARALFAVNPRFVFFRRIEGEGPIGAQGVPLTPRRSLAVDRRYIPLGVPVWLDTVMPGKDPGPLRRLVVAQDAGGAIKGVVRGDFFWGYGAEALAEAGRMTSRGRYYLLLPKAAARRISQR